MVSIPITVENIVWDRIKASLQYEDADSLVSLVLFWMPEAYGCFYRLRVLFMVVPIMRIFFCVSVFWPLICANFHVNYGRDVCGAGLRAFQV